MVVFLEIGGKKQLTESVNALRAVTYGALNELQSTPAGAGLPANFSDRVFQFERARRTRKAPTLKDLEKIAANEKEHAALLSQLAEAKAAEEAELQAMAKKKAKAAEDALAAAKKKAAQIQAEIAALEA